MLVIGDGMDEERKAEAVDKDRDFNSQKIGSTLHALCVVEHFEHNMFSRI
jgi:hypothetical protein